MLVFLFNRYIERRTGVYCLIVKRENVDKSYSIGEVEKKKEVGDKQVGTGVMIDQESKTAQIIEVTKDKKVVWVLCEWDNPNLGRASGIQLLDEKGKAEKGALQR